MFMNLLEYIPLIGLIFTAIILAINSYSLVVKYYRRPKLVLEPHYWSPEQNVRLLGFIVRNVGRDIAKGVYGTVLFNSASSRICWNDSPNYQIDMLPGPLNECWFYVAELKKTNGSLERFWGCFSRIGPAKEYYEITVKLFWDYYGLRSLTRRFSVNLSTWDKSKIIPIN